MVHRHHMARLFIIVALCLQKRITRKYDDDQCQNAAVPSISYYYMRKQHTIITIVNSLNSMLRLLFDVHALQQFVVANLLITVHNFTLCYAFKSSLYIFYESEVLGAP